MSLYVHPHVRPFYSPTQLFFPLNISLEKKEGGPNYWRLFCHFKIRSDFVSSFEHSTVSHHPSIRLKPTVQVAPSSWLRKTKLEFWKACSEESWVVKPHFQTNDGFLMVPSKRSKQHIYGYRILNIWITLLSGKSFWFFTF